MSERPIRILLGKVGLDLHDIGAKYVASGLRDAGMEVIYLGPFQTAASIVNAALEEDPDAIAISSISGEYKPYVREIARDLEREGIDPLLVVGGLVAPEDREELAALGVDAAFGPGSTIEEIVAYLRAACAGRRLGKT